MNWCDPALLLKSEEHHRGNLRLTLFLFRCFQGCVFWFVMVVFHGWVFYFFLLVRSFFICILYIYIFREKLEHLRDTENETLRGNGKHQETGVLILSNFPFRYFCFLSILFFPPCPGFERKSAFCFSFISSLFFLLSFCFSLCWCLSWICFFAWKMCQNRDVNAWASSPVPFSALPISNQYPRIPQSMRSLGIFLPSLPSWANYFLSACKIQLKNKDTSRRMSPTTTRMLSFPLISFPPTSLSTLDQKFLINR